jgi:hypothetical protein
MLPDHAGSSSRPVSQLRRTFTARRRRRLPFDRVTHDAQGTVLANGSVPADELVAELAACRVAVEAT